MEEHHHKQIREILNILMENPDLFHGSYHTIIRILELIPGASLSCDHSTNGLQAMCDRARADVVNTQKRINDLQKKV